VWRCLPVLALMVLSGCATVWGEFGDEAWLRPDDGGARSFRLERREPRPPPIEGVDERAIEVVRAHVELDRYEPFHTLAIDGATVVAYGNGVRGLELASVRGETVESTTPIAGDQVFSARLVARGTDVVVMYSLIDSLVFARWSPATQRIVIAPRTVAADLPSCIRQPRVDSLVSDGQLLWASFTANARGRHGDTCAGIAKRNAELSATIAITADGAASELLLHPLPSEPARLSVDGGRVVGQQGTEVGFVVVPRA
jgi:hypothetical protein